MVLFVNIARGFAAKSASALGDNFVDAGIAGTGISVGVAVGSLVGVRVIVGVAVGVVVGVGVRVRVAVADA